ncbi:TPA: hypothetical protein EYP27_04585 [Candidatus Bathyarchaeota archaeon]|nr:hypothetical protein [Candidatus Bathyarchaeota archaeon]
MMRFTRKEKRLAWAVSILLGVMIIGFAAFLWPGHEVHPDFDNFFVIGVMIAIFPPAFLDMLDRRWRESINRNIVYLIRNVAEAQRTGMTFDAYMKKYAQSKKSFSKTV